MNESKCGGPMVHSSSLSNETINSPGMKELLSKPSVERSCRVINASNSGTVAPVSLQHIEKGNITSRFNKIVMRRALPFLYKKCFDRKK